MTLEEASAPSGRQDDRYASGSLVAESAVTHSHTHGRRCAHTQHFGMHSYTTHKTCRPLSCTCLAMTLTYTGATQRWACTRRPTPESDAASGGAASGWLAGTTSLLCRPSAACWWGERDTLVEGSTKAQLHVLEEAVQSQNSPSAMLRAESKNQTA